MAKWDYRGCGKLNVITPNRQTRLLWFDWPSQSLWHWWVLLNDKADQPKKLNLNVFVILMTNKVVCNGVQQSSIKVVKYWGRQFGQFGWLLEGTCSPSRNSSPKNDQMIWAAIHIYCTSPYSVCQGPPTLLLESYCPTDFISNTTACNYQVILNTLITWFRRVWSGLELKFCRTRVLQEQDWRPLLYVNTWLILSVLVIFRSTLWAI